MSNARLILCTLALAVLVGASFLRIYVRVQTTVIGYQIGTLKDRENKLLEKRSHLKIELAKITSQEALSELAELPTEQKPAP